MNYSIYKEEINSTLKLLIAVSPDGVERIDFSENTKRFLKNLPSADWKVSPTNKKIIRWLNNYCGGKTMTFPYKLNPKGTEFQMTVWKTMQKIPHGETRTYKWIAQEIGRPSAVRAVGSACGANPIPLLIPCHRVVASNGLGGFSSGLDIKKKLLKLEKKLPNKEEKSQ
jgi:O-6-methylguanine DNA methyltransferase